MIQWFPGHMAKAKKEIEEKLKIIDIVFELVDARIPFGSKNPEIGKMLKNKPKLLLLTKANLADPQETKKWAKFYEKQGYQVLEIDSISGLHMNKIVKLSKETLSEKLAKEKAKGMLERPLRAMIVGIPNVGKSTLINTLVHRKSTMVGDKPGVTKAQQWVRVNKDLDLLDTPGVLWPKFEDEIVGLHLAITGAIKDDILDVNKIGEYFISFLKSYYPNALLERFSVDQKMSLEETIEIIAAKRQLLKSDAETRVYDMIIRDLRSGRLGKITLDQFDYFFTNNLISSEL